jgi:hypothetical protein
MLLDVIILIIPGEENKCHGALRYAVFPPSRHFIPLQSKYSPQHPVLKRPQSMILP